MFKNIDFEAAAARIDGVVKRTPIISVDSPDPRIDLRCKLENRQETGSFKCRGAWNQISQLTVEEARAGVVTTSSGNHGRALSWAARRAGVHATIVMSAESYPNKIAACRELGAEVVLSDDLAQAEAICAEHVRAGRVLIHPYDAARTVEGAGTVGREIALDWPDVEVVVVPVGGGGLISGTSLALRRAHGPALKIFGAEPIGAPSMTRGLEAGEPVLLPGITTQVQGLCPLDSGKVNISICMETVNGMFQLEDDHVIASQRMLVAAGEVVEPAGAAGHAAVAQGMLPAALLDGRSGDDPLRVIVVVSGGNPEPDQLAAIRG